MAKTPLKSTAKSVESTNPKSAGLSFKTKITNPLHQEVGNSSPERLREINILKNNAKLQLEWAQEEQKAAEELEEHRKKIEKIRSEIEKIHFKTEKEIDEYVLAAELAEQGYIAHKREFDARKAKNIQLINAVADEEIQIVGHDFDERIRAWKTRTETKKQASTAKYEAEIAQEKAKGNREKDPQAAQLKAIETQRMKAFIAGKPMAEVEAIGAGIDGNNQGKNVALLDRFTFNF